MSLKTVFVEVFPPNRDNAGKAEMLFSFKRLQLRGWRILCAGRVSATSVVRVRMLNGTCLSHCSSVFVFRVLEVVIKLFSCFGLQQYKQSILLVCLVAKGGVYFNLELSGSWCLWREPGCPLLK